MKNLVLFAMMLLCWAQASAESKSLSATMLALDTELFSSFNNCENEQELIRHTNYFDPNVEFYHDNGGVTWNREDMIRNTRANACGNFTRELVVESFSAHPIKSFGAITKGVHLFCQRSNQSPNSSDVKTCEGKADFVMVWRNDNDTWQVTRVLSYGHQANE